MHHRYEPSNAGVQTPLILWICAAICAHFVMVGGGDQIAQVHEDHKALVGFAERVQGAVDLPQDVDIDLSGLGIANKDDTLAAPEEKKKKAEPKKVEDKKTERTKPEEEKKEPEKKIAVQKQEEQKTHPPLPMIRERRIAVRQHVKPNQEDNPEARFIANEANRTDEERVATITSHDRDDENPNPAGNHDNADKNPGDSENLRIAESEAHKGTKDRAPGERGTELDIQMLPPTDKPMSIKPTEGPTAKLPPQAGGDGRPVHSPMEAKVDLLPKGNESQPNPHVVESPGGWMFQNPEQGPGSQAEGRDPRVLTPPSGNAKPMFGLGAQAMPGRPNINLTQSGVVAIVGADQLRKEREADGERRKSEHRGSWQASNFEKWRSAIENYVSSVKPGNQTSLNTAAVPFATYLNGMHNRIHPIFADSFLASLDGLPPSHPLNDLKLVTHLEIVLSKEGRLVKMGVVKTSGNTAFDIAALDSVDRAQPFGPAPSAIVSPDGRVYLHWEFHRDEVYACSTQGAMPYMLKGGPPDSEPSSPLPRPSTPSPTKERGTPMNTKETREGLLGTDRARKAG
jgi:TonB family protein